MSRRRGALFALAGTAVAATLLLGACGDGGGGSSSAPEVGVSLSEYRIAVSGSATGAGKLTFRVKDVGGAEHEMVVVKVADPRSLPTKPDGSVDEDQIAEADKVGEVEDVAPGQTKTKTLDLASGTYTLFCNIVDTSAAGTVSHFAQGMYTTFTVP